MTGGGPPKRARQACEPCRRKKARCPGERPACSYCHRLGQRCFYSGGDVAPHLTQRLARSMNDRMSLVEGKLDQLLQRLETSQQPQQPGSENCAPPGGTHASLDDENALGNGGSLRLSPQRILDPEVVNAGQLYLKWCHQQPLLLFDADTFMETLDQRDQSLIAAVKALALRFAPAVRNDIDHQQQKDLLATVRRTIWHHLADGEVELYTLQALCLNSINAFYEGDTVAAALDLSLANQLIHAFAPRDSGKDVPEFLNCARSLNVLKHHQSSALPSVLPLQAALSSLRKSSTYRSDERSPFDDGEDSSTQSISRVAAELARVWYMGRKYAAGRPAQDDPPPWMPNSDFADVMVEHQRWESIAPRQYRFAANRFDNCDLADLQANRQYWSPWVHTQILFAGIPCLLNHPFLLAVRLREFRHAMPQSFIQQSYEQITRHAGWIMYFIDLLEKKSYELVDPIVAHCVVIVATIQLQHSFVQDAELSHRSQVGFGKCLSFLQKMGEIIPIVAGMAENLGRLQASVSVCERSSSPPSRRQQLWSIDTSLLNDLLRYETAGRRAMLPETSISSNTLVPRAEALTNDTATAAADYDLVGSAGISAHRTAPTEAPINAPGEPATVLGPNDLLSNVHRQVPGGPQGPFAQSSLDPFGTSAYDPMLFLPANDHWRSIDDWLTLNAG